MRVGVGYSVCVCIAAFAGGKGGGGEEVFDLPARPVQGLVFAVA